MVWKFGAGVMAFAMSAPIFAVTSGEPLLYFEPNLGQAAAGPAFLCRGAGYGLTLSPGEAVFRAGKSRLVMAVEGFSASAAPEPMERLGGVAHYLIGNDESRWITDVPRYGRVRFRDVYPGVDVVYYSRPDGALEYDLSLRPGADPSQIRLRLTGAEDIHLEDSGELVIRTRDGEFRHASPAVYQMRAGKRRAVSGRMVLRGLDTITFDVREYDRALPLTIDPVIVFSTYLGGSGQGAATSIALDPSGNAYSAGWTETVDFPVNAVAGPGVAKGLTAFVAKFSSTGQLAYVTYFGGSLEDRAYGIGVDSSGSPVITGWTYSSDFPVVNAAQSRFGGGRDGFLIKLAATGKTAVFSTFIGGTGYDSGNGVALDSSGNVYVAGDTTSSDFPVMNPIQQQRGGADDAFVAKFSASGARQYATYLGGVYDDSAAAIAVDGSGNAYITGGTYSPNFPIVNALQSKLGGGQDAFVAKVNSSGTALLYSTYLGGSGGGVGAPEAGVGIAVDSAGAAYVAGNTSSADFPLVSAFQGTRPGGQDIFVAKVAPGGGSLVYSSYLGGSSVDIATAIAVDSSGGAYVGGYTASGDMPTSNGPQSSNGGAYDAIAVKVSPTGNGLQLATYLGGNQSDAAFGIAVDTEGNIYLAGETQSGNFPNVAPVQTYMGGAMSAFLLQLGPMSVNPQLASPVPGTTLSCNTVTFIWNRAAQAVDYRIDVGTTPGGTDVYSGFTGNAPFQLVRLAGLLDGRYLYVQLYAVYQGRSLTGAGTRYAFATTATKGACSLAAGQPSTQSSTVAGGAAANAVDGNPDGNFWDGSVSHTNLDANAWFDVDLGAPVAASSIMIRNRTDCCGIRLANFWVFISKTAFSPSDVPATLNGRSGVWSSYQPGGGDTVTVSPAGQVGRFVRVQLAGTGYLSLAEVEVYGTYTASNLALGKAASQSSTLVGSGPEKAVDGNSDGNYWDGSVTHTNADANAWWQVDLGTSSAIGAVAIWNRTDGCSSRLANYWLFVSDTPFSASDTPSTLQGRSGTWGSYQAGTPYPNISIPVTQRGRYVRVQLAGTDYLSLAEVQVFGQQQ